MQARRWWIATLLFLSTFLNYFDRQILALVSPVLRSEFSLSATQYAHLLSSFLFGYTLMQFVAGRVVDWLGAKRGLLMAMLWWSAAGALASTAHNASQLGIFLFLMGVGEAANWPAGVKAIREWFPPNRRALAVGFFNAGSSAGAIAAPIIVTTLTLHSGWRTAFLCCGILGLLWIGPWIFLYKQQPLSRPGNPIYSSQPWQFLRDGRAWGIILARFFADSIWFFYIFWLPDYLSRARHLSLREIGSVAWIPFLAAAAGNFAGGALSGSLIRRRWDVVPSRLAVMAASAVIMFAGAIAVQHCSTYSAALLVISLVVFAYSAWAANILTLPGDIFPSNTVATVVGASGTAAGLGGMLTTFLVGRIVDNYSYNPVFWIMACLPLLALACCLLTMKKPAENSKWGLSTVSAENHS